MNRQRLKKIETVSEQLTITSDIAQIRDLTGQVEDLLSEEEEAFDGMPENLQYSMNGERAKEAIDALSEALDVLASLIGEYEDAEDDNAREAALERVDEAADALDMIY